MQFDTKEKVSFFQNYQKIVNKFSKKVFCICNINNPQITFTRIYNFPKMAQGWVTLPRGNVTTVTNEMHRNTLQIHRR